MHASSFSSSRWSVDVRIVEFGLLCKINPAFTGLLHLLITIEQEYNSAAGENGFKDDE